MPTKIFMMNTLNMPTPHLRHITHNWSKIIICATRAVERIPRIDDVEDIRQAVRMIVMSIALEIVGVEGYTFDDLSVVGGLINCIWLRAKSGETTSKERDELYSILSRWKTTDEFIEELARMSNNVSKECAILSILIPSYETMYRVVLPLLFHTHKNISFTQFLNLNISPSLNSKTEQGYTYLSLIQESLRLYPVVKRIKRSSSSQETIIDIAAIHKTGGTIPVNLIL